MAEAQELIISPPESVNFAVLRVRDAQPDDHRRLSDAFQLPWPVSPASSSGNGGQQVLALAPGEWALVGFSADTAAERALRALPGRLSYVADVSDGTVRIRVSGRRSRDLLAKSCSLDLHPREFRPGACAQTLLAQVQVLLHRLDEADTFDVYLDRSLTMYFGMWLDADAVEFRLGR